MQRLVNLMIVLSMGLFFSAQQAHAITLVNGGFETGDLTGFFVEEDFSSVLSSPLATVVDDGSGTNYVARLDTGYTSHGVYVTTIGQQLGAVSNLAQSLSFDFMVMDNGPDAGGGQLLDALEVSFFTDVDFAFPLMAEVSGYAITDPGFTNVSMLGNGFYRAVMDLTRFHGQTGAEIFFDLYDEDDGRLTKAFIDNLSVQYVRDTVIPEPTSLVMVGMGFLGLLGYRRSRTKPQI